MYIYWGKTVHVRSCVYLQTFYAFGWMGQFQYMRITADIYSEFPSIIIA